jgi:serine/threonine protein phosphatase PrpC
MVTDGDRPETQEARQSKTGKALSLQSKRPKGLPIHWRSSAQSNVGKQRKVNEDAYLVLPKTGIWAVADGMGGHDAGDVASRAVVQALGTLKASGSLETLCVAATECLKKVNTDLLQLANTSVNHQIIGTTVVVMLAAGERCASIWAGDSRLYRFRTGELIQLTRDHSLAAEASMPPTHASYQIADTVTDNVVTRAVGAEEQLQLETITFTAQKDDIYLLCSDGLFKELNTSEIYNILKNSTNCHEISQLLIHSALEKGARDNVTVAVISADRQG